MVCHYHLWHPLFSLLLVPTSSIFPRPHHDILISPSSPPSPTIFPSFRPSEPNTGSDSSSFMALSTPLAHMATTVCVCRLHEMARVKCGCVCQLGHMLWKNAILVPTSSTFPRPHPDISLFPSSLPAPRFFPPGAHNSPYHRGPTT